MDLQRLIPPEQTCHSSDLTEQLRQEVVDGLLYSHHRANTNTTELLEVTAFAYALIELLLDKGLISEAGLNDRKRAAGKRLVETLKDEGMGVMLQQSDVDKYAFERNVQIDCENRIHLCKAACCRLKFALSKQDLEEGIVKWDLARPYMIAHAADGYCRYFERGSWHCQVYPQRPTPCRAYDCRSDSRIWADFEQKRVSSDLENLFQTPDAVPISPL